MAGINFENFKDLIFLLGLTMIPFAIFFVIIKIVERIQKKNNIPIRMAGAKVVSKHSDLNEKAEQTYYASFDTEKEGRVELSIPPGEYGVLMEGNSGNLIYQGTKFIRFDIKE